jgi:opacity protein-like surface antigen
MKKIVLASACILALASTAAFAQTTQPTGGASSQGNVGPGASQGAAKDGTGTMNQATTGTSSKPSPRGDASTSGAGTAAGPNNTGTATEPGSVQKGANQR